MTAAIPASAAETVAGKTAQGFTPFQIPRLASSLVTRDRLTRRLDRLAAVTVLHALTGFGKTALVGAWAQSRHSMGATILWMTATASPDSESTFAAMLREADARRTAGTPLILVIDDAHHLTDPRVVHDLCTLLSQDFLLHVVAISRVRHPLVAAAESRQIELDVLSARDLAADPHEFINLARSWGHTLDEDDALKLHSLVDGWIAPAKLVLDGRHRGDDVSLNDRARDFIRSTMLPESMETGGLALAETITEQRAELLLGLIAQATDQTGAANSTLDLIGQLECAGLIEPTGADGSIAWAFRSPIRRELVMSFEFRYPVEAKVLHGALAVHFAEHGDNQSLGMALTHARRAEEWAFLSSLYSEHSLRLTFDFPSEALGAYGHISPGVLDDFPSLAIPAAIVHSLTRHADDEERAVLIRAYAAAGKRVLNQMNSTMSMEHVVGAASAGIVSLRSEGLLREALELALRIESELIERRTQGYPEPAPAQLAWFLMQCSLTCLLAGQDARAAELSARAVGASLGVETEFIATNAAAQLALIHTLNAEHEQAERWLARNVRLNTPEHWVAHLVMLPARIAQVHRALHRLDNDAASAALVLAGDAGQDIEMWAFLAHAMVEHALLFGEPMAALTKLKMLAATHPEALRADSAARRIVDRCTVDLLLALGELHRAQHYLANAETDGPWLAVPRARLQLIAGNSTGARDLADSGAWRTGTPPGDRVDLLLIAATAELALGHHQEAAKAFSRAHELAQKFDRVLPYALVPARVRDSLLELSGISLRPEVLDLVATIRGVYPEEGELIVLTSREEVVLGQMFLHDTIPAIAEALTLSVNTIKKQTVSIYAKLGVSERASALARAHRLGLLEHQR